jgi:hypothetical protein
MCKGMAVVQLCQGSHPALTNKPPQLSYPPSEVPSTNYCLMNFWVSTIADFAFFQLVDAI